MNPVSIIKIATFLVIFVAFVATSVKRENKDKKPKTKTEIIKKLKGF